MSAVTSDPQFYLADSDTLGEVDLVDTDTLVEAVLCAPDPRTRAAIIATIVQDLCAAVAWVHAEAPGADSCAAVELDGVHHLGLAAQRHRLRMSMAAARAQETR